jgi:hypothetical protein
MSLVAAVRVAMGLIAASLCFHRRAPCQHQRRQVRSANVSAAPYGASYRSHDDAGDTLLSISRAMARRCHHCPGPGVLAEHAESPLQTGVGWPGEP